MLVNTGIASLVSVDRAIHCRSNLKNVVSYTEKYNYQLVLALDLIFSRN